MKYDAREHWEGIYQTKNPNELSWYQEKPQISLNLIVEANLDKDSMIIDIGAGDSRLVDNLLDAGYRNITVLDVSSEALEKAKKRLENRADTIKWVISDIREFETSDRYDLWHDRALLHFLTKEGDINKYVDSVNRFLKLPGYLIISTFSVKGPKKCSGLDVRQYSEDSMERLFSNFERIKSFEEEHVTPWGTGQIFIYNLFRRK